MRRQNNENIFKQAEKDRIEENRRTKKPSHGYTIIHTFVIGMSNEFAAEFKRKFID